MKLAGSDEDSLRLLDLFSTMNPFASSWPLKSGITGRKIQRRSMSHRQRPVHLFGEASLRSLKARESEEERDSRSNRLC
jgi:hypothetical protein